MNVAEVLTGPLTAYRLWRVMPYQPLDGPPSVRLCTAGTRGIPPVWPPREPLVAVCSDFRSTHSAPSLNHECGAWAVPSRKEAEERVSHFLSTSNFDGAYGWAVGEVALWGRVVEHKQGYRAQFAYPINLSVATRRLHSALVLADAYGVPVDWRRLSRVKCPKKEPRKAADPAVEQRRKELAAIKDELANITRSLPDRIIARLSGPPELEVRLVEERQDRAAREKAAADAQRRAFARMPAVNVDGLTLDEVLIAFAVALAADRWPPTPTDVLEQLLLRRGEAGPFSPPGNSTIARPGFLSARSKLIRMLERASSEGLMEGGLPDGHSTRCREWYLTATGIEHTRALFAALPLTTVSRTFWHAPASRRQCEVDVLGHLHDLKPRDPARKPFDHEIAVEAERWRDERRRVQREGHAALSAWLVDRRARPQAARLLRYDDDEIVRAVRHACRKSGDDAPFPRVMYELAPGTPLAGERSAVSYRLGKLAQAGTVERVQSPTGLRWAYGSTGPRAPRARSLTGGRSR